MNEIQAIKAQIEIIRKSLAAIESIMDSDFDLDSIPANLTNDQIGRKSVEMRIVMFLMRNPDGVRLRRIQAFLRNKFTAKELRPILNEMVAKKLILETPAIAPSIGRPPKSGLYFAL